MGENNSKIDKLVSAMMESYLDNVETVNIESKSQINKAVIIDIIDKLRRLIFAGFFSTKSLNEDSLAYYVGELMDDLVHNLKKQIARVLRNEGEREYEILSKAEAVTYTFLERLPEIRRTLATDISASYDGDPSAYGKDEIILSYPGIYAIMVNRLAHELWLLGVPFIPRIMTEHAHSLTGIDIHPGATIGHHFFIDHGTGIVIGETTVIGNHVTIYQGVTLGALSTRGGQLLKSVKRHPTIEDNVVIYSGASILGGGTVIGEGVVIGSNAFITKSVPEKTKVSVKNPELQFKASGLLHNEELTQEGFWDYVI